MSPTWAIMISVALLALNGFFVAAEFALVASQRHRLEQAAAAGSRAARAAVAGSRELSLMLAGAQLGITLCSLGLGALAKPAVAYLLEPVLAAVGLPDQVAYVSAVVLALSLVVFAHMVIGEMAPKSWAISHPERSAMLLALPFRGFARAVRPVIAALNGLANSCLRLVKVTPQNELAQVHGPEELRILVEESRKQGMLAATEHKLLTASLGLRTTTVAAVMTPADQIVSVATDDTAEAIERVSRQTGRSRLAVVGEDRIVGVVHVRDAVRATTVGRPASARQLMTEALTLRADCAVLSAVRTMRDRRAQVGILTNADGDLVGLVALEDLLEQVIGEFDDETDPIVTATRHNRHQH